MSINLRALRSRHGVDRRAVQFYRDNVYRFYLKGFRGWLAKRLLGNTLRSIVVSSYASGWEYGVKLGAGKQRPTL